MIKAFLENIKNKKLYRRLYEAESDILLNKKFTRKDIGF